MATTTIIQQNVAGTDSNIGFFFGGWSNGNLIPVQIGWYAQGENVKNGLVTDINLDTQTITIENTQQFKSGRSYYFTSVQINYYIPCFGEDTKILCLVENKEQYIPIQNIRKDDLVKTLCDGYKKVDLIGKSYIHNPDNTSRNSQRLFRYSKENFDILFEDLFLTGGHSILLDSITEEQITLMKKFHGNQPLIDNKHSLLTFINQKTEPYTVQGIFTVYHIALENENPQMSHGIFANGLLVESCSHAYMTISNMTML